MEELDCCINRVILESKCGTNVAGLNLNFKILGHSAGATSGGNS
jgi:hypothetical protein